VDNPTLVRSSFTVEGNTIRGLGPAGAGAHGIVVRNGAQGVIRSNVITDYYHTRSSTSVVAVGILAGDGRPREYFPLLPVRYEGNTFSNNNLHMLIITANESQVINNIFHGSGPGHFSYGLGLSGTNILAANNDFSEMPAGIFLYGAGVLFDSPHGPATNPKLDANWFCGVAEPIHTEPGATGADVHGTALCENGPFQPVFQSITKSAGMTVRSWHGQSVVLEASSNLQHWAPIHTNLMAPSFQYQDPNSAGFTHRFYRALVP